MIVRNKVRPVLSGCGGDEADHEKQSETYAPANEHATPLQGLNPEKETERASVCGGRCPSSRLRQNVASGSGQPFPRRRSRPPCAVNTWRAFVFTPMDRKNSPEILSIRNPTCQVRIPVHDTG